MSYYKILGFDKEPFSTSPDPEFLYMSKAHEAALANTLIELNLKRGLSIILGDIGTGKTTLSRKLIQELSRREKFVFQMILNPVFQDEEEFMRCLVGNFNLTFERDDRRPLIQLRDTLEKFILEKTLKENKVVVIIIDEAQKLNEDSMETLRILLNYETNEFKLIQLVLFGQKELYPKVSKVENFYDRISFKSTLYPFCLAETKEMIYFRLKKAGYKGKMNLFLDDAIREIHNYTAGYPRGITMVCHRILKNLLLEKKYIVDAALVRSIIQKDEELGWRGRVTQRLDTSIIYK